MRRSCRRPSPVVGQCIVSKWLLRTAKDGPLQKGMLQSPERTNEKKELNQEEQKRQGRGENHWPRQDGDDME